MVLFITGTIVVSGKEILDFINQWKDLLDIIGWFVGGFLGAFFAYWFALYQRKQEQTAKREMLLKMFYEELSRIDENIESYSVNKTYFRDTIYISSLARLLDGETLEYKRDSALIYSLLNLRTIINIYNDYVNTMNLVQHLIKPTLPPQVHEQIYQIMVNHFRGVLSARDSALKNIPDKIRKELGAGAS